MLTDPQIERYSRHILLDELGGRGQRRLLGLAVRVSRLDAAGRACLLWLARAGLGRLHLPADHTPIDERHLPDPAGLLLLEDAGRPLAAAVAGRLAFHQPGCEVVVAGGDELFAEVVDVASESFDSSLSPAERGVRLALALIRREAGRTAGGPNGR